MGATIGHPLKRHELTAGIDDADADDLFQLPGFFDRRIDDDVAAFLGKFR